VIDLNQVSLRRGSKLLFEKVTFQLHAGHRLGCVGANGSGKSSLFALLLGELEADAGEVRTRPGDVVAHVAQQSPDGSQPAVEFVMDGDGELRQVQALIRKAEAGKQADRLHALYERLESLDGYGAEARASRLLHGLGFSADSHRNPVGEFSGGWRMRLNLARALMCRSDVLLLDEPTNHLDLPAILWLERWLQRYQGVLMLASHDRDFLDAVCNRIAHIEHQRINLYNGAYSAFEEQRSEQLAQQQALYKRQQREIRHIQSYVDRFRYKASKARQAQSRLKMLERMTRIAPAYVDSPFRFRFLEPAKQPQQLLRLEEVSAGYTEPVLSGVNLRIAAGDRVGLLGVNGAGKSTLVKALSDGRTVLSGTREVSKDTRVGYFAQHQLDQLDPALSPIDHLRALAPRERESDLRQYIGRFGFSGERIFDPVAPFSGGEKARLVLALMIRQRPNLLLLDEPTNHLDLEMRQALGRALVDYAGALVVISHDRHLLRSVCDDFLIIHRKRVDPFDRSLDDYPAWLRAQNESGRPDEVGGDAVVSNATEQVNRKQKRREEAMNRQRLKPLSDRVRKIESDLSRKRESLLELDARLSDPSLYSEPGRKNEMTDLMRDQARLKIEIDALEGDWLDASHALEQARAGD
jgi:ATP-binding cassette subfamily F protein 3